MQLGSAAYCFVAVTFLICPPTLAQKPDWIVDLAPAAVNKGCVEFYQDREEGDSEIFSSSLNHDIYILSDGKEQLMRKMPARDRSEQTTKPSWVRVCDVPASQEFRLSLGDYTNSLTIDLTAGRMTLVKLHTVLLGGGTNRQRSTSIKRYLDLEFRTTVTVREATLPIGTDPKFVPELLEGLTASDCGTRSYAAAALGKTGRQTDTLAIQQLQFVGSSDECKFVQREAVTALKAIRQRK